MTSETKRTAQAPYIVLSKDDHQVLGPEQFGSEGLQAVESIGPYVDIQAVGPLITIHDSTVEPHLGIGHHPHRHNERIFYMLKGSLDHDDKLNDIQGHMGPGDVGLLTEGRKGMRHSEWNNGDDVAHAYILVYPTDPMPENASFDALRDADAPRYEEGPGIHTKELVGPKSPLHLHGDIRLFTDSTVAAGSALSLELARSEGGVLWVHEGLLELDGRELRAKETVLVPPDEGERGITVTAKEPSRVLRVVTGPGHGLIRRKAEQR
jgi:redox-sensitive bicupin YhaK (pirin superfamily)